MQTRTFFAAALLAACPLTASAQNAAPETPPIPVTTAPTSAPATPPVTPAAPGVTLRLKFTPGQTLYYSMTVDSDGLMLTGQSGAGIPLNNRMVMLLRQTVKDVRAADGAATLESGIDSMTMIMNGQTIPLPPDTLAQMKTVGTTVVLPTGKVLSFTPSAALAAKSMPGMDLSHTNAFSSMGQLPDGPIKPGDTWKTAVATGTGMIGVQAATNFSLTGVDTTGAKTVAEIHQTTDAVIDSAAAKSTAPSPTGMKMLGKINGTGALRFDVDGGFIESATSHLNMTMTMSPKAGAAGMKMQMKISSDMQRVEAPAPPAAAPPVQ